MTPIKRNSPMSTPEFNPIEIAAKSTSAPPKHRADASKNTIAKVAIAALVLSGVPFIAQVQESNEPAVASNADTIGLFLSAPMVQGTDVTEAVTRENFDTATNCADSFAIASITLKRGSVTAPNNSATICRVTVADENGGASTDTAVRTTRDAARTKFMSIPYYDSSLPSELERSITFTFPQNVKYLGFWWTAGSPGNIVRFFDESDQQLAVLDSQQIQNLLGNSNTSTVKVRSVGYDQTGVEYDQMHYFGNPWNHTSFAPTSPVASDLGGSQIFGYLNLYVGGSFNVKKVQFAGPGFEFDNLAVSTSVQAPSASMVEVSQISRFSPPSTPISTPSNPSVASPVVLETLPKRVTVSNEIVTLFGAGLNAFTGATVNGRLVEVVQISPNRFSFRAPAGLTGTYDITLVGNNTTLVVPKALTFGSTIREGARTVVPGFAANSTRLTKEMRKDIRAFLRTNPGLNQVVCRGFTSAPATPQDRALARDRGKVTCDLIKRLRPEATVTLRSGSHTDKPGVQIRRVQITLR
jgi:hypothetical protein